tara:strand:- start:7612 stop:7743 length:132 start_codon:yes stop_codon:yes gene_type:complete
MKNVYDKLIQEEKEMILYHENKIKESKLKIESYQFSKANDNGL